MPKLEMIGLLDIKGQDSIRRVGSCRSETDNLLQREVDRGINPDD